MKRSSSPSRRAVAGALAAAMLAASSSAQADPPAPAAGMYAPAPPAPPSGPAATAQWTRVHIVTPRAGVALERRAGSLPTDPPPPPQSIYANNEPIWQQVCAAPCDVAVQLGGEYRIGGEGVTPSSGFALHGPTTELRVDAGAYSVRRAGVWLIVLGSIAAATGAIFMGVNAVPKSGQTSVDLLNPAGIAAISAMAGGGTLALIGIGCVVGGGTSVRDETRRDLAQRPNPVGVHATFVF